MEKGNYIGGQKYNNAFIWNLSGEMTVNGGYIESLGYCISSRGYLTINDGEFVNLRKEGTGQYAIYADSDYDWDSGEFSDPCKSIIIRGGTIRGYEGGLNAMIIKHLEISGGNFFVIYGPAPELYYPLYIFYCEEGEISGGNFYAANGGQFTSAYVDYPPICHAKFTGGNYSGNTHNVSLSAGYSWESINIASPINGCVPLTKRIVKSPSAARRR